MYKPNTWVDIFAIFIIVIPFNYEKMGIISTESTEIAPSRTDAPRAANQPLTTLKRYFAYAAISVLPLIQGCNHKNTDTPPTSIEPGSPITLPEIIINEADIKTAEELGIKTEQHDYIGQTCSTKSMSTFTRIITTGSGEKNEKTVFFYNPYDCFTILVTAYPPDGNITQEWLNDVRKWISHQPQFKDVPINYTQHNELPLVSAAVKPEFTIDAVFKNARKPVKYYNKIVPLCVAVDNVFEMTFADTKLKKYLDKQYATDPQSTTKENPTADYLRTLMVLGLISQESTYINQKESEAGAIGIWQITPYTCKDVSARHKSKQIKCDKGSIENIGMATLTAVNLLDDIFISLQDDLTALDEALNVNVGQKDYFDFLLLPCLITAYHSGINGTRKMIRWFLENQIEETERKLITGEIFHFEIFDEMNLQYYHANRHVNEQERGTYGPRSATYFHRVEAWAELLGYTYEEEVMGELTEQEIKTIPARKSPKKKQPTRQNNNKGKSCGLKAEIPEHQVSSPNYPVINNSPVGNIRITGGFMEPRGHGHKRGKHPIIKANGEYEVRGSGPMNLGIDYVESRSRIITWYGGIVVKKGWEGGYGNRTHIQTDVTYTFQGQTYQVYQAYAHARSFKKNIQKGTRVKQGETIGIMGSTGGKYGAHIDCRTYIIVNGQIVDLNINALENQLQSSP